MGSVSFVPSEMLDRKAEAMAEEGQAGSNGTQALADTSIVSTTSLPGLKNGLQLRRISGKRDYNDSPQPTWVGDSLEKYAGRQLDS